MRVLDGEAVHFNGTSVAIMNGLDEKLFAIVEAVLVRSYQG